MFHPTFRSLSSLAVAAALLALPSAPVFGQDAAPAPNRAEGEGPFDRLIARAQE